MASATFHLVVAGGIGDPSHASAQSNAPQRALPRHHVSPHAPEAFYDRPAQVTDPGPWLCNELLKGP